ncbi:PD-(D/E)XK nuclease family protein, partial [bacterium]|nr:PD-(D/E)XK nuclease family protein [bacterium]
VKSFVVEDYDYTRDFQSAIDCELNKINYYSPSLINPYIKCPRMFFFDRILGLNSANFSIPDALNFGSAIHKTFENMVYIAKKEGKFPNADKFLDEANKQIDKYPFSTYSQREQYKLIANTTIKDFYEKELSLISPETIYNVEKDIIADFEGVKFKGLPDMINLVDNKFRIYDYKTGRAKGAKEICLTDENDDNLGSYEEYYIQMGLYKYFLEKTDEKQIKV